MAVCSPFDPDDLKNENKYTNVEYSPDGKSVTIYLDGSAPVPADRALTKSLAILGHDFFEATFVYRSGSGTTVNDYIVARGSWELGEPAGISGVYRGAAGGTGVPYGSVSGATALSNNPAQGSGIAILFAGKKTDKTLLAIGALSGVDGNPASRTITNETKSVSFALNALKAGAGFTYGTSSLRTNATSSVYNGTLEDRTSIRSTAIRSRTFPMYTIPLARAASPHTTRARYTLDVHAPVSGYTPPAASTGPDPTVGGNHFDYYRNTIRYAPDPPNWTGTGSQTGKDVPVYYYYRPSGNPPYVFYRIFNIEPHFTETNVDAQSGLLVGTIQTAGPPLSWHDNGITNTNPAGTAVSFYNYAMTNGSAFVNPIMFTLDPAGGADNKIFSFAFQIPVYALSDQENPVTWFIRPGYDKYFGELDNGKGENGGAILVGIGNITASDAKYLEITRVPKIHYNPANPNAQTGYVFDISTMEVKYYQGNSSSQVIPPSNNLNVEYFISVGGIAAPVPITQGDVLNQSPYPAVPPNRQDIITVRYYPDLNDKSVYFDDMYTINVTDTALDVGNLVDNNRIVVTSNNSWTQFSNMVQNSSPPGRGTYLVVFATSFNIPDTTINITGNMTLVMTANMPGVTVGRVATGTNPTLTFNGNGNVTVFLGTWPSDVPVMAGGDVLTDYPFRVNANGTYQLYPGGAITTGKMFFRGTGTGTLNVSTGPDIRVSDTGGVDNLANFR